MILLFPTHFFSLWWAVVCWLSEHQSWLQAHITWLSVGSVYCPEYQSSLLCWVPCPDSLLIFQWNCYLWSIYFFFFLIICGSFSSSISFKLVSSFGLWLCACVLTWEIPASLLTLSCSLHLSRKRICYQSLQARGCESTREPGAWDALPTRRIICASVLVKSRRWLASPGFCSSEWECFCLA